MTQLERTVNSEDLAVFQAPSDIHRVFQQHADFCVTVAEAFADFNRVLHLNPKRATRSGAAPPDSNLDKASRLIQTVIGFHYRDDFARFG